MSLILAETLHLISSSEVNLETSLQADAIESLQELYARMRDMQLQFEIMDQMLSLYPNGNNDDADMIVGLMCYYGY